MLIDEQTFQLLKNTITKNGWLEIPSTGNSMFPFIRQGNLCRFVSYERSTLKKGDVILFTHAGQLIAHRLVGINHMNNNPLFLLKGDTNLSCDQPITENCILGKLVSVKKQNKIITPNRSYAHLWGRLILSFPVISVILRKYLQLKLKFQY